MPTDLYRIYKLISQRSRRNPKSLERLEMNELAHDLVKRRPDRDEMLAIIAKMEEIELRIPGVRSILSSDMKSAIEENDYVIDVPYVKRHAWNEPKDIEGHVYIATALRRPGLSKLGATYDDPQARLAKYAHRYGYAVTVFWSAYIYRPFKFEAEMTRLLSALRFAGLTFGDSNEWYRIAPEDLKAELETRLRDR